MKLTWHRLCNNYDVLLFTIGPSAPNTPTILSTTVGSTQVTISWIVTAIAYTPESYFIVYGVSNDSLSLRSSAVDGSVNLTAVNLAYSATIMGLSPFTRYYYKIEARNSFTTSESDVSNFQTNQVGKYAFDHTVFIRVITVSCTAPSVPPNSFSVARVGSRNVTLTWSLPDEEGRNGVIVSYTVACNDSNGNLITTLMVTALSTTYEGLQPYSFYTCDVLATTSGGDGPAATLNFTTASDGKCVSISSSC